MVFVGPFEFELQISPNFQMVFLACLLDLGRGEQVGLIFASNKVVYHYSANFIIEHLLLQSKNTIVRVGIFG